MNKQSELSKLRIESVVAKQTGLPTPGFESRVLNSINALPQRRSIPQLLHWLFPPHSSARYGGIIGALASVAMLITAINLLHTRQMKSASDNTMLSLGYQTVSLPLGSNSTVEVDGTIPPQGGKIYLGREGKAAVLTIIVTDEEAQRIAEALLTGQRSIKVALQKANHERSRASTVTITNPSL